jgi:enoyl-CoA hydratase
VRLSKSAFHAPREAHPLIDNVAQAVLFETEEKFARMDAFLTNREAKKAKKAAEQAAAQEGQQAAQPAAQQAAAQDRQQAADQEARERAKAEAVPTEAMDQQSEPRPRQEDDNA